jgi:hypothetical protein
MPIEPTVEKIDSVTIAVNDNRAGIARKKLVYLALE